MKKLTLLLITCLTSQGAIADNWQPFTGAERLNSFVSGVTVEIHLRPGVTAVGTYHPDGTAQIRAWNESFPRTWEVKGESIGESSCVLASETDNVLFSNTWVPKAALKQLAEHAGSLKQHPPIKPGTPDPYQPPR